MSPIFRPSRSAWVRRHEPGALGSWSLCCADGARRRRSIVQPPWLFRATHGSPVRHGARRNTDMADHPLTGAGPQVNDVLNGAYGIDKPQLTIVHNAYVQVLVDIGIVGAAVVFIGG